MRSIAALLLGYLPQPPDWRNAGKPPTLKKAGDGRPARRGGHLQCCRQDRGLGPGDNPEVEVRGENRSGS